MEDSGSGSRSGFGAENGFEEDFDGGLKDFALSKES